MLRAARHYPRGEFTAVTLRDLGLDLATAHDRALTEVLQILRSHSR